MTGINPITKLICIISAANCSYWLCLQAITSSFRSSANNFKKYEYDSVSGTWISISMGRPWPSGMRSAFSMQ